MYKKTIDVKLLINRHHQKKNSNKKSILNTIQCIKKQEDEYENDDYIIDVLLNTKVFIYKSDYKN